jgi:hypothetical protein
VNRSPDLVLSRPAFALALLFLVLTLTVWAYAPGLAGGFVLDDVSSVVTNEALRISGLNAESLWAAAGSGSAVPFGRPASMLSFALNYLFWGEGAYSFKVVNLAIHLLTGLGLFILTLQLLSARRGALPAAVHAPWIAAIVATVWLVHPLNLTGVLYIVQRMASLSALFTVLGLSFYLLARRRALSGQGGQAWLFLGVPAATLLAVLSKENGALLPLFALLLEVALFRFRAADGRLDRAVIGFFVVFLLLPAVYGLGWVLTPEAILGGYQGRGFEFHERLLTQARALVFYLQMLFVPQISELGLFHDDFGVSTGLWAPPSTLPSVVLVFALVAFGLLMLRRERLVGLGVLWFFVAHLLESTVISLELVYEHRNYLASFGPILAMVIASATLISILARGPIGGSPAITATPVLVGLIVVGVFSWQTHTRAQQWSNPVLQATYEALHHPTSPRALYNIGSLHAKLGQAGNPGSLELAFGLLERALAVDQATVAPGIELIMVSDAVDRPIEPEWVDAVAHILETRVFHATTLNALAKVTNCQKERRCTLPDGLLPRLFDAASRNPAINRGGISSATVLATQGTYLLAYEHDPERAVAKLETAATLAAREPKIRVLWANALLAQGDLGAARKQLRTARELDRFGLHSRDIQALESDAARLTAVQQR